MAENWVGESGEQNILKMRFGGDLPDRREFLKTVRTSVSEFTGERMTLDTLIVEIAKNIFDHANGRGSLSIVKLEDGRFRFEIKDEGEGGA